MERRWWAASRASRHHGFARGSYLMGHRKSPASTRLIRKWSTTSKTSSAMPRKHAGHVTGVDDRGGSSVDEGVIDVVAGGHPTEWFGDPRSRSAPALTCPKDGARRDTAMTGLALPRPKWGSLGVVDFHDSAGCFSHGGCHIGNRAPCRFRRSEAGRRRRPRANTSRLWRINSSPLARLVACPRACPVIGGWWGRGARSGWWRRRWCPCRRTRVCRSGSPLPGWRGSG